MELEEMKASWNILNGRLEKSEMLNKRIIKEMITNRTLSAHERLLRYDIFGLIVCLGIGALFLVLYITGQLELKLVSFVILESCLLIGLVVQLFFIFTLGKLNLEKMRICELIRTTLTYKLWMKRNYTIGSGIGVIGLITFLIIEEAQLADNWELRFIVVLLLAFVAMYYQVRFYRKNIRIIEKGLEELKEFEEEPELN